MTALSPMFQLIGILCSSKLDMVDKITFMRTNNKNSRVFGWFWYLYFSFVIDILSNESLQTNWTLAGQHHHC
jgi:hypothetical protein